MCIFHVASCRPCSVPSLEKELEALTPAERVELQKQLLEDSVVGCLTWWGPVFRFCDFMCIDFHSKSVYAITFGPRSAASFADKSPLSCPGHALAIGV